MTETVGIIETIVTVNADDAAEATAQAGTKSFQLIQS